MTGRRLRKFVGVAMISPEFLRLAPGLAWDELRNTCPSYADASTVVIDRVEISAKTQLEVAYGGAICCRVTGRAALAMPDADPADKYGTDSANWE